MKKLSLYALAICLLGSGCQKVPLMSASDSVADFPYVKRSCASQDILNAQLLADPSLAARRAAMELQTDDFMRQGHFISNGVITIPVVVNVLYRTSLENINIKQIQSQIDVLNADYNNTNADRTKVPSAFSTKVGNVGIKFVLDTVIRKVTSKKSWSANDAMKKSNQGGISPTDPTHKLNMWACNLGNNLLGYAQFPGGNAATDGVVILYSAFGSQSIYPSGTYTTAYNLGRTASHEVGHWLNLYHIWGDDGGGCTGSDQVGDTPNQGSENYGCPTFPHVSCSNGPNGDMFMNYMDYTDDACMFMFSAGQASRIQAAFASGGGRNSFAN